MTCRCSVASSRALSSCAARNTGFERGGARCCDDARSPHARLGSGRAAAAGRSSRRCPGGRPGPGRTTSRRRPAPSACRARLRSRLVCGARELEANVDGRVLRTAHQHTKAVQLAAPSLRAVPCGPGPRRECRAAGSGAGTPARRVLGRVRRHRSPRAAARPRAAGQSAPRSSEPQLRVRRRARVRSPVVLSALQCAAVAGRQAGAQAASGIRHRCRLPRRRPDPAVGPGRCRQRSGGPGLRSTRWRDRSPRRSRGSGSARRAAALLRSARLIAPRRRIARRRGRGRAGAVADSTRPAQLSISRSRDASTRACRRAHCSGSRPASSRSAVVATSEPKPSPRAPNSRRSRSLRIASRLTTISSRSLARRRGSPARSKISSATPVSVCTCTPTRADSRTS